MKHEVKTKFKNIEGERERDLFSLELKRDSRPD